MNIKNLCAIKIQSLIRGYFLRKAYLEFLALNKYKRDTLNKPRVKEKLKKLHRRLGIYSIKPYKSPSTNRRKFLVNSKLNLNLINSNRLPIQKYSDRELKKNEYIEKTKILPISKKTKKRILAFENMKRVLTKYEKRLVLSLNKKVKLSDQETRAYLSAPKKRYERSYNSITSNDRSNILILFARNKHFNKKVVSERIFRNHKVDTKDKNGNTALFYAAVHNNYLYCEFLIKNGADINMICEKGNTPFHMACKSNNIYLVSLFLNKKADPNVLNNEGFTPLAFLDKKSAKKLCFNNIDSYFK